MNLNIAVLDFPGVIEDVPCRTANEVSRWPIFPAARAPIWQPFICCDFQGVEYVLPDTAELFRETYVLVNFVLPGDAHQVTPVGFQDMGNDFVNISAAAAGTFA